MPDGIHVFDFHLRVHLIRALRTDGDVGVNAHRPVFHTAFGRTNITYLGAQCFEEFHCVMRRAEIRLGDDFDQRCSRPVEIHQADREAAFHFMHELGNILLHVNMMNAQSFRCAVFIGDVNPSAPRQRQMRLRKLIALG